MSQHTCYILISLVALSSHVLAQPLEVDGQTSSSEEAFSLTELEAIDAKLRAAVADVSPAVVALQPGKGGRPGGIGSGVVVSKDGLILTAAHVANTLGESAIVIFADGDQTNAKVLGMNFYRDIAMLKISKGSDHPHVEPGDNLALKKNDFCFAMGHPRGFQKDRPAPVRFGRVYGNGSGGFVSTSATITGGDSGGPLFDLEGKLVGIHSTTGFAMNDNSHAPVSAFQADWKRLLKGERFQGQSIIKGASHDGGRLHRKQRFSTYATVTVPAAQQQQAAAKPPQENQDAQKKPDAPSTGRKSQRPSQESLRAEFYEHIRQQKLALEPAPIDLKTFDQHDVALLKLEPNEEGYAAVALPTTETELPLGAMLAAAGTNSLPVACGVLSVQARPLPEERKGYLGVEMGPSAKGVHVRGTKPLSPAEEAGIKRGDIITSVNDTVCENDRVLARALSGLPPGTVVKIQLLQDDKPRIIDVELGDFATAGRDSYGTNISKRAAGLASVLQTALPIIPQHCCGPVVDIDGNLIGISIARAGRVKTYVIRVSEISTLIADAIAVTLEG